jgi:hypothetical protein
MGVGNAGFLPSQREGEERIAMGEGAKALSADEQLAREIADALISEKIVSKERENELIAMLSGGRMQAEDWKLYIEMGLSC